MDLDRLEASKRVFGTRRRLAPAASCDRLGRTRFHDAASLIRFHEALLFFRAYPPNREVFGLPSRCSR